MEISKETLDQILQVGERFFNKEKLTDAEKKLIKKAYFQETGKRIISNCGACYADAYMHFVLLNKNPNKMKSQFTLIEGKKIMIHGHADVITSVNLTDANALEVLKRTPGAIKFFAKYPEDWKKQAEAFDAGKAAKESLTTNTAEIPSNSTVSNSSTDKEAATGLGSKREVLESKTVKELKELALSEELPEAEFKKKNKADLINYIIEKTA